ncbi:protein kinase [Nocardioides sp. W7]|uniref:protein kinase domain-containing protein n=1 Tax=Nocardioides sp. W7 TaxID=2931390 RepID=UPI002469A4BB|nr:protein kinase [Nocardioides sp. W7]
MSEPQPTRREDVPPGPGPTRQERGVPPTRHEDAAPPTRHEGGATAVRSRRLRLPDVIAEQYEHQWDLPPTGAQADVAVCRDRETGAVVAVKLYRIDADRLDQRAILALRDHPVPHVMPVLAFESRAGATWEVQEYLPAGSLDNLVQAHGGRLPTAHVHTVVRQLHAALTGVHALDVVHRDLKAQNVLLRSADPIECVLADFGLASGLALSQDIRSVAGTWAYMPPEAHNNIVTRAGDWWALGVVAHEIATGRSPFADEQGQWLPEHQLKAVIYDGSYELTPTGDGRLDLLITGLMTHDREQRWGSDEVAEWLGGGTPAVATRTRRAGGAARRPFPFAGSMYDAPAALAAAMREHWREAGDMLAGVKATELRTWLERAGHEQVAETYLTAPINPDRSSVGLQAALDPAQPPVFQGRALDGDALRRAIRDTLDGDADAATWVSRLRRSRVLSVWAAEVEVPPALALVDDLLGTWWAEADRVLAGLPAQASEDVGSARPATEARLLLAAVDPARRDALATDARAAAALEPVPGWVAGVAGAVPGAGPGTQAVAATLIPAAHAREVLRLEEVRRREAEADRARRDAERAEQRATRRRRMRAEARRTGPFAVLAMAAAAGTTVGVSLAGVPDARVDLALDVVLDALPRIATVGVLSALVATAVSIGWHALFPEPRSRLTYAIVPLAIVWALVDVATGTAASEPWTDELAKVAITGAMAGWIGRLLDLGVDRVVAARVGPETSTGAATMPAGVRRGMGRRLVGVERAGWPMRIGIGAWLSAVVIKAAYFNDEIAAAHPAVADWPTLTSAFADLPPWYQDGVIAYLDAMEPVHAFLRDSAPMSSVATLCAVLPALLLAGGPQLRELSPRALQWAWVVLALAGLLSASYHLVELSAVVFGAGMAVGAVLLAILAVVAGFALLVGLLNG